MTITKVSKTAFVLAGKKRPDGIKSNVAADLVASIIIHRADEYRQDHPGVTKEQAIKAAWDSANWTRNH